MEFVPWPKTARLNRDIVVTEKLDGTNAAVVIEQLHLTAGTWRYEDGTPVLINTMVVRLDTGTFAVGAQSRKKMIYPGKQTDNAGLAAWVHDNAEALVIGLGEGRHFGEWIGPGIQGNPYKLESKLFYLFNTARWKDSLVHVVNAPLYLEEESPLIPVGVRVVPVLYEGPFSEEEIINCGDYLRYEGSAIGSVTDSSPRIEAEGIVIWHEAARTSFKVTLKNDEKPKGQP